MQSPQTWNRYAYATNNPILYVDPDGREPNKADARDLEGFLEQVRRIESEHPGASPVIVLTMVATRLQRGDDPVTYLYTSGSGWIDSKHFFNAADTAETFGEGVSNFLGLGVEATQAIKLSSSTLSYEDLPSNAAGADFGDDYLDNSSPLSSQIRSYLESAGAMSPELAPNYDRLPANGGEAGSRSNQSSDVRKPTPPRCERSGTTSASGC